MSDRVTYWAIHELLTRLGFTWQKQDVERVIQPPKPKICVVYRHTSSGTTLSLPVKDDQPALAADVLSVRTHLAHRGLLDEDKFEELVKEYSFADQT